MTSLRPLRIGDSGEVCVVLFIAGEVKPPFLPNLRQNNPKGVIDKVVAELKRGNPGEEYPRWWIEIDVDGRVVPPPLSNITNGYTNVAEIDYKWKVTRDGKIQIRKHDFDTLWWYWPYPHRPASIISSEGATDPTSGLSTMSQDTTGSLG
jgi:hypothetical protein